jgi:hypothetical protein
VIELRKASSSMPSSWKVGIGVGLAALLVYAVANAGQDNVRFVNVDGKTFRMTRLGGGRFEMATWGVSLVDIPNSQPMASVLIAQDGLVKAEGVPDLIDLIRATMNKVPGSLFTDPALIKCNKPGCTVVDGAIV